MRITWDNFFGIQPKADPRLLPDPGAQVATNTDFEHGGVRGARAPLDVMALSASGVKSIYRFGQALASATQYWFQWTADVDVVKGPIEDDTLERTYWTGDGAPKFTTNAIGLVGTILPSASRPVGVVGPATAPTLVEYSPVPPPDGTGKETRVYVYTFVNDFAEESVPSLPATVEITITNGVTLSGMETTAANGATVDKKRIYRAQQGQYLFVAEIAGGQVSYSDTLASAELGEVCPSITWDPPPATLTALIAGPNGVMAGVDGYTVRFCEPFRPFAWPMAYSQTVGFPCVGLGQFGQTFVVLTTGLPYLISGVDPATMSVSPAQFYEPCVAKRSIVSTGGAVLWASPDGLVSISPDGGSVLTAGIFTGHQWRALNPESIVGAWTNGWYVGSYDKNNDGTREAFMFRPSTQEWVDLPGMAITAMYRDTISGRLYLCIADRVVAFQEGERQGFTWKSKKAVTSLSNIPVARVTGDYPLTFTLFKDGVQVFETEVQDDDPFKLPSGLARGWEIQVAGTGDGAVLGVVLADSMEEA